MNLFKMNLLKMILIMIIYGETALKLFQITIEKQIRIERWFLLQNALTRLKI